MNVNQLGTSIASYLQNNNQELPVYDVLSIWQTASAKLQTPETQIDGIWQTASAKLEEWATPPDKLFYRLNFSSLLYIAGLEDSLKRAFYEQEAIRGCWTYRELDRQVSSRLQN